MDYKKLFPFMTFNEADDDNTDGGDTATNDDPGTDEGDTTDGGDTDADTGDDDGNDEFDIDTSIDGEEGGDEGGGDTTTTDTGGGTAGGNTSSMSDAETEANPVNTEIFDSLTPEEQAIKIKELKRLYKELYTSIADLCKRMEDTKIDEDNIDVMDRINSDLYDLKTSIRDYFTGSFENKSYIENDIKFSQFLFYLNSIRSVIEKVASSNEKKHGEEGTKDQ